MKEIHLEERKRILLEILSELNNYCDENNIKYFLCAGTLLGAIRHKGFIPWDDDIDVAMPRPDYDRFEKEYISKNKRYSIISINSDTSYDYPFMKIYDNRTYLVERKTHKVPFGIYIDIFPIDGLSEDKKRNYKQYKKAQMIYSIIYLRNSEWAIKKRRTIFRTICKFIVISLIKCFVSDKMQCRMLKKVETNAKKNSYDSSEFVTRTGSLINLALPRKIFDEQRDVEFENDIFKAPVGYHEYLTHVFKDYMKLPPIEQRKSPHLIDAYWI